MRKLFVFPRYCFPYILFQWKYWISLLSLLYRVFLRKFFVYGCYSFNNCFFLFFLSFNKSNSRLLFKFERLKKYWNRKNISHIWNTYVWFIYIILIIYLIIVITSCRWYLCNIQCKISDYCKKQKEKRELMQLGFTKEECQAELKSL